MFGLLQHSDQILFQRVMGLMALIFVVFVESALGHIPAFFGAAPKLTICFLFILTIKFPFSMTLLMPFVAGLIFDLIQGSPLGYSSSVYLLVYMVAEWRRPVLIDSDVGVLWFEFVLMILGLMFYTVGFFAIYEGRLPPLAEIVFQAGLSVLIFPLVRRVVHLERRVNFGFWRGG